MNKEVIMLNTGHDGYSISQCGETMTVGELIAVLSEYDEDTEVFFKNDDGYTYGWVSEGRIELEYVTEA